VATADISPFTLRVPPSDLNFAEVRNPSAVNAITAKSTIWQSGARTPGAEEPPKAGETGRDLRRRRRHAPITPAALLLPVPLGLGRDEPVLSAGVEADDQP